MTLEKIQFALEDLADLDRDCQTAITDGQDGPVSAIFAHNCITSAQEILTSLLTEMSFASIVGNRNSLEAFAKRLKENLLDSINRSI